MPNSWDHHQLEPDATCIAPPHLPYGRWNTEEIIWAAVPAIIVITLWRAFFCHILGPYIGGYVARRDYPTPHPKPSYLSTETLAKLKILQQFYNEIEGKKSKVPKKKKKPESAQQKCDLQLTTNIKRRNETRHRKHKRKALILPKGLNAKQSPDNLAFLASLDSDSTRQRIPQMMQELGYKLCDIRAYCHYKKDSDAMRELTLKFNEEAWKGLTMFFIAVYGLWVMSREPFFAEPALLFKEWPQVESWRVFLYYQIATGYHAHRAVWQFWERKRSDLVAMFIHHWVTVVLIASSWYWGIMNIGAVVMVVHDNADVFLPLAKLGRWLRCNAMKNVSFIMFTLCWICSRVILFSWKVIIPVFMYAPSAYSCHYGKFVFFAFLLIVLLCLHLYWLSILFRVAGAWIFCNKVVEDTRSDNEENQEEIIIQPEEFSSSDDENNSIDMDSTATVNNAAYKVE